MAGIAAAPDPAPAPANTGGKASGGGKAAGGAQPADNGNDGSGGNREERRAKAAQARRDAERAHAKRGTTPNKRQAFDPKAVAVKAMRERKQGLRLAAKDGENVDDGADNDFDPSAEDADDAISPDAKDADTAEGEIQRRDGKADPEEHEPEKVPSWAKKLKDEVAQHKAKIEEHTQREGQWTDAYKAIESAVRAKDYDIADYKDDIVLRNNVINQLVKLLDTAAPGKFVREGLDLLLQKHENKKLSRRTDNMRKEQQTAQQAVRSEVVRKQVRSQLDGMRAKFPELDWTKNPAAKEFFTRYANRKIPMTEISEAELLDFVRSQRFAAQQRKPAKRTDVPAQTEQDPPETSVRGGGVGTRSRAAVPEVITNSYARKLVQGYRAAKQRR